MAAITLPKNFPTRYVVIDSDETAARMTESQLKLIGCEICDVFTDGEEGFQAIHTGRYHAAVIDWKIKGGTSGLAVLGRLRRKADHLYFPVLFTTGLLKPDELRMLQDYQCVQPLEKPVIQRNLLKLLTGLVQESVWYVDNERKIEEAFTAADLDAVIAKKAIVQLLQASPNPTPLALIAAKHLMMHKYYTQAGDIYDEILKRDPNYLPALSAKARLLSCTGKHKNAMALLQRAYSLSPKNLERLSLMGEIEVSLRHPEAAITYFQKALGIDANDRRAKIGMSVAKGYSQVASLQTSVASYEPSVAKIINNLGVQLAQQGQYEKALKYYLMSFSFLADDELQSKVSFNMGIGFKRWSKLSQAKYWFEKSLKLAGGKFPKAERYVRELAEIKAIAGLGGADPVKAVPRSPMAAPVPVIQDTPPHVAPRVSIAPVAIDQSFLEEESVETGVFNYKKDPVAGQALDKMIADIDDNLDLDIDENLTFDEAI